MGCGSSKTKPENSENEEQRKHRLLRESWAIVEKDLETLATKWFLLGFQAVPQALEFFHFKDEEDLKTSKWLRLHATMNWRMIGRLIKSIDNPVNELLELHTVAKAHAAFSLNQEVFDVFGGLLLTVLEEGLGPTVWNDELSLAWKETFDFIAKEMLKGIAENKPTILEGQTPEAKRQQLVAEDWKTFEADLSGFGAKLVARLVEIAPECLEFFEGVRNTPPAEMANNPQVRGHGRLMLRTFGRAVRNQKNLSVMSQEILVVGRSHTAVRTKNPGLFSRVGEALLWLLETETASWDEEHKKGWENVIAFVVDGIGG